MLGSRSGFTAKRSGLTDNGSSSAGTSTSGFQNVHNKLTLFPLSNTLLLSLTIWSIVYWISSLFPVIPLKPVVQGSFGRASTLAPGPASPPPPLHLKGGQPCASRAPSLLTASGVPSITWWTRCVLPVKASSPGLTQMFWTPLEGSGGEVMFFPRPLAGLPGGSAPSPYSVWLLLLMLVL